MMSDPGSIVIVGGGHASAQLCGALAAAGHARRVHLICGEPMLPYHRPPLSKSFLKSAAESLNWHRPETWYADAGITVHCGDQVVAIDRSEHVVRLKSGAIKPYGVLVIAAGARARRLPHLPDDLANVAHVRSAADALRLRDLLATCQKLTVIGGGFIGLEVAAAAHAAGKAVQVLESAPRLLARAVSAEVAEHVRAIHHNNGIDIRVGVSVGGFEVEGDRLKALAVQGIPLDVDLMVQGIGAEPEQELAREAGLRCENGIVVDEFMRTSDAAILAVGDCTSFPHAASGRHLRLESVQNANDQARTAAATILGKEQPYRAVPSFWSDQGGLRLQMAGLVPAQGTAYRRPGKTPQSFSILHYVNERLSCVESVNAPMDHLAARKLLEGGHNVPPSLACDPALPLKDRLTERSIA